MFMMMLILLTRLLLFFLVFSFVRSLISIDVLLKFSIDPLHSMIIILLELFIYFAVPVRSRSSTMIGLVFNAIVAEGLEELEPVGEMVAVALSDSLAWDMVEIELNDGGDFLNDFLYFLAGGEGGLWDFEDIDHAVWEDNFINLKVYILMPQRLDLPDVPLDAHIVEDVHCQVYYLRVL